MTDSMVASGTPNTPADTANPGGSPGYDAAAQTTAATTAGTTTPSTGFSLNVPTGSMPASLPAQYEDLPINEAIAAGVVGKGTKAPDLTRLSDLVKLATAISQGLVINQRNLGPSANFDEAVLKDVFSQAGISGDLQAQIRDGGASPNQLYALSPDFKQGIAKLNKVLWTDITNHLTQLGVALPADASAAPNGYNMMNKLHALGSLPVGPAVLDALRRQGFATNGVSNVQTLVSSHDLLRQAAQGAPGLQVPASRGSTGAQVWNDFVTTWNDPKQTTKRQNWMTDLADAGLLDLTNSATTVQDVATAYQKLIQDASTNGVSVGAQLTNMMKANPNSSTSALANVAQQEVNDQLAAWGVPVTTDLTTQLVNSVLQSGQTSPYEIARIADTTVENYAKGNVGNLYGPSVAAKAAAGQTAAQQAQSYQAVAQNLLGIPASSMLVNDPSGKWMAWSQGGSNPDGSMTLSEWAGKLMSDPQYGYQGSAFQQRQQSGAANALLQLFGKVPAANPFGNVQTANSAIGGA